MGAKAPHDHARVNCEVADYDNSANLTGRRDKKLVRVRRQPVRQAQYEMQGRRLVQAANHSSSSSIVAEAYSFAHYLVALNVMISYTFRILWLQRTKTVFASCYAELT